MVRLGAVALLPLLVCAALCGGPKPAQAAFAACPSPEDATPTTAADWGLHLAMAQAVQEALRLEGAELAIVSRAGLNLRPIGQGYSHAGFLRPPTGAGAAQPWTVRQLYWDCDTAQPRIFDEGLASFVAAKATGTLPRLSVLWWPPEGPGKGPDKGLDKGPGKGPDKGPDKGQDRGQDDRWSEAPATVLARAVADEGLALRLLSPRYQAHAHAWSPHTQNCNQWLVEMLAAAFGGARDRAGAQAWLREQAYEPAVVRLPWAGWLWAAAVMPHLGLEHHPQEDLRALQLQLSLPSSIEDFVRRRWPQVQRTEWCRRGQELVVRSGWQPLDEACTPRVGDRRLALSP